jgi:hypothetical protein
MWQYGRKNTGFENRVLRVIFAPERNEITGGGVEKIV